MEANFEILQNDSNNKSNSPFYKKYLFQIIEGVLILGLLIAVIILGIKVNKNNDSEKEEDIELQPTYPIKFQQPSETTPAKTILMHYPDKEVFMAMMHPAGFLGQYVSSLEEINKELLEIRKYLNKNNIAVIKVRDALKRNRENLYELAFNSLTYEEGIGPEDTEPEELKEKYRYYLSDEYKNETLKKFTEDELVDVIVTKPTYVLDYINTLTYVYASTKKFRPTSGLIFCRDQQITTKKGVVIGHLHSKQREIENDVLEAVFKNIGVEPIGRVPFDSEDYLEGGDFFVAKKNLSMLGIGLRSTIGGAKYLMENDLLDTRYLAVVYDKNDQDNDRMHLDTVFNILSDEYVVLLDFDTVPGKVNISRTVFLYDNEATEAIESSEDSINNIYKNYKLIKEYDSLEEFLYSQNYKVIKITNDQQKEFMINFLNIGNDKIISVHKDLEKVAKSGGCTNLDIHYINYTAIQILNGAAHCTTQVSRV